MTSHARRLQYVQRVNNPDFDHPPSIVSGNYSSSNLSSRASSLKSKPLDIKKQCIPEDSVVHFESNSSSNIASKQKPSVNQGTCSSIISSRSPTTLSSKDGSRLSIMSMNKNRMMHLSRSLGGSKASLVSTKSYKSSIQQEYHDVKVQNKIQALSYGKSSKPFLYSKICFGIGGLLFLIGLIVICLRIYGQIFLSVDKGELIGPIFIAFSLMVIGLGIIFLVRAYRLGAMERRRLGYRAVGPNMVVIKSKHERADMNGRPKDYVHSGTTGDQAVSRKLHLESPQGSRMGSVIR